MPLAKSKKKQGGTFMSDIMNGWKQNIEETIDEIKSVPGEIKETLANGKEKLNDTIDAAKEKVGDIKEGFEKGTNAIKDGFEKTADTTKEAAERVYDAEKTLANSYMTNTKESFKTSGDNLKYTVKEGAETAKENLKNLGDTIKENKGRSLGDQARNLNATIKENKENSINALKNSMEHNLHNNADTLKANVTRSADAIQDAKGIIKGSNIKSTPDQTQAISSTELSARTGQVKTPLDKSGPTVSGNSQFVGEIKTPIIDNGHSKNTPEASVPELSGNKFNNKVIETIRGNNGNGQARRDALGKDYDRVQGEVNRLMKPENRDELMRLTKEYNERHAEKINYDIAQPENKEEYDNARQEAERTAREDHSSKSAETVIKENAEEEKTQELSSREEQARIEHEEIDIPKVPEQTLASPEQQRIQEEITRNKREYGNLGNKVESQTRPAEQPEIANEQKAPEVLTKSDNPIDLGR